MMTMRIFEMMQTGRIFEQQKRRSEERLSNLLIIGRIDVTAIPYVLLEILHHSHSAALWHWWFRFLDLCDASLCCQEHACY